MRKNMKKIMALGLAGVMMLGMSTVAFAAGETSTVTADGKGAAGAATTTATSINIPKSVVVENPAANITVAYPQMTFTYTVTPKEPTSGADVTDGTAKVAVVKGETGGVTLSNGGQVSIPSGTVTLNKNGQEIVSGNLTVSVDLEKFTSPGVYRYEIKDTTTDTALTNPGVVRSASLDKEFVLDVYIAADEENEGHLGVAGYVLTHNEVEHIDGNTDKDSGFDNVKVVTETVPGEEGEDPTYTRKLDDTNAATLDGNDFYYTYNATLTKAVTGAMGDKNNTFEFTLTVTNKSKLNETTALNYYVDGRTTKGGEEASKTANLDKAYLKDGDTVTIYGLNPYATVNYTEKNNTASTYTKVTVSDKADYSNKLKEVSSVTANGTVEAYDTAQTVVTYAAAAKATDTNSAAVKYENNLAEISPTGVVMRFAPYLIMMAGAFFLIAFTRRRRVEE